MQRDSLDFGKMRIGALFISQFVPTLLGMVSSALFIIVDGIFVGRGIGTDALAAVNITTPISVIGAGIGLMFGMGGSILASINLSRGKTKVANINITQAFVISILFSVVLAALIMAFPIPAAKLLGADGYIIEPAAEFLYYFVIFLPLFVLSLALPFFVRLTNPVYAMVCMLIGTILNILCDYLFIFVFKWGLIGAACATGLGLSVGVGMLLYSLYSKKSTVRFTRLKMSSKSIRLTIRNGGYIIKLGFSTFLSESAIAIMALSGNYVFIRYLGPDGVAAFSIVCYLFPIVFMVFNAAVQSVQPIISFNYGCGQFERSKKALKTALYTAGGIGLGLTIFFLFFSGQVISLFVLDTTGNTFKYASEGLPLFALDFMFFAINIVTIGYLASIEKIKLAGLLTILRPLFSVLFFFTLPLFFDIKGIWLAVFVSDVVVTLFIFALILKFRTTKHKAEKQVLPE